MSSSIIKALDIESWVWEKVGRIDKWNITYTCAITKAGNKFDKWTFFDGLEKIYLENITGIYTIICGPIYKVYKSQKRLDRTLRTLLSDKITIDYLIDFYIDKHNKKANKLQQSAAYL